MSLYPYLRSALFQLDPELAHGLTLKALQAGFPYKRTQAPDPVLQQSLWGLNFLSPVGLAAGFDKEAIVAGAMLKLGFGFVELGTVTPKAQKGNDKPRIFRLVEDEAIINRMGFPGSGATVFSENLRKLKRHKLPGPIGINIGMNKGQADPAQDYAVLIRELGVYADYITVNVSSPNTPGLRDLQKREFLLPLLDMLHEVRASLNRRSLLPVLVKLSPDLDQAQQEELAKTLIEAEVEGIILSNTTIARPENLQSRHKRETAGGLSGMPLREKSFDVLKSFVSLTDKKIPLISVGGVSTAEEAYRRIKAGASVVQLYSALVFHGPDLPARINDGLARMLHDDGFTHIKEAIGSDHA
ncbi:MAG: quinone-dependent dihydroorotate dehydrogenase [Alphaproteobacteria bacterium]|nr:quinone-dependent dihydroorotate dehydrogenase [Alphaproteobacteria bacterium]